MAGYGGQGPQKSEFWYVYILKCINGTIYTGCTKNLQNRIKKHNQGKVIYTKDKLPVELVT